MKNTHSSLPQTHDLQGVNPIGGVRLRGIVFTMVILSWSGCSTAPSARGAGPAGPPATPERIAEAVAPRDPPAESKTVENPSTSSAEVAGTPPEKVEAFRTAVDQILGEGPSPTAAVVLSVNPRRLLVSASHGDISASRTALPPGSTVKPLLYAAALSAGELQPEEPLECSGKMPGDGAYACYATHGKLTLPLALATSCNIYGWRIVDRLGWPRVRNAFERVGFGGVTGLESGEAGGVLPPLRTEDARKTSRLVGLGHGALRVTALQLAAAYAKLVSSPEWGSEKFAGLREGMRLVVEDERGTGRAAAVSGWGILGKTGTAEDPDHPGAENGFFVGIAPADAPKWVVVAIVRGAGSGGKTAAPVVSRVFSEYLRLWPDATGGAGVTPTGAL